MYLNVVCIFNYSVQGGKLLINTNTNFRLGFRLFYASVKLLPCFKTIQELCLSLVIQRGFVSGEDMMGPLLFLVLGSKCTVFLLYVK